MSLRFRFCVNEAAGSLGDLATFLPLALGLVAVNGLNPTALFLSAGLLYLLAGLYFRVPIPVQPLKATSALAIALAVPAGTVVAAAFWVGVLLLLVSLLPLDSWIERIFTRPVVRGIQLGIGVLLVKAGLAPVLATPAGAEPLAGGIPPWIAGVAMAVVVAAIIGFSRGSRRYPATLVVIPFGVLAGRLFGSFWLPGGLALGWVAPAVRLPTEADLYTVFVVLLLPQIPLTLANSVTATAQAARSYFGEDARRVTHRALAASLGIGNLAAGLVGGMPMCHGSGGLTAHYRFGARTGASNIFIGGLFILAALFLGKSLPAICRLLPTPVLGALLVYVGVQHARLARDVLGCKREGAIAGAIGLATLLMGNLAVAFAGGVALQAAANKFFPTRVAGR